jgi:hypothetical protein
MKRHAQCCARDSAAPETSRFKAVFAALADAGVDAEQLIHEDDVIDAVRAQLVALDGVLVWVNPIHEGRNRANLDALLREVAARGVWGGAGAGREPCHSPSSSCGFDGAPPWCPS